MKKHIRHSQNSEPPASTPDGVGRKRYQELIDFMAIPSVSTRKDRPDPMNEAVRWVERRLGSMGPADMKAIPHDPWPVLWARFGSSSPDAFTLLIYGHYDVVDAGDEKLWSSPPFEARLEESCILGRGAADMKGPLMACIWALEDWLEEGRRSGIADSERDLSVILLFEGAEEAGSRSIRSFLQMHPELVKADLAFTADAGMYAPGRPSITTSLKGLYGCRFALKGATGDLHSGVFGGAVLNPNQAMAALIAGLHDKEGRISITDAYADLREPDPTEKAALAAIEEDVGIQLSEAGIAMPWGDTRYSIAERMYLRPSISVSHLHGGQPMNIIPSRCEAFVSIRMARGQCASAFGPAFRRYLEANCPRELELEILSEGSYEPSESPPDDPWIGLLEDSMKRVWNCEILRLPGNGGIPVMGMLQQELGIPVLLTGLACPGDHIHGADEQLSTDALGKGTQAYGLFLSSLENRIAGTDGRS